MSINPLKEFFKKRKAEVKFARAGPGQTLSSESSKSSSSSDQAPARQAAAEAAMKRFNKDKNKSTLPHRTTPSTNSSGVQPKATSDQSIKKTSEKEAIKELPVVDGVVQRNIQIYSTEELAQRIKQPEIDDDFFRLTVDDVKLFKQRYDEERARNEILKTSEMRRREAEAKKPTTNFARLRFKLPNNKVLEASFSGSETLMSVRDWLIVACIEKTNLELKNFDILFGLRPFKEVDYGKSVKELGLLPATTLTILQKI